MLVIVVCIFGLCWLPLHTFIIVIDFNPHLLEYKSEQQEILFTAVYYFAHWLAMSNSFANPIIYGFTNDSFRVSIDTVLFHVFECLIMHVFSLLRYPGKKVTVYLILLEYNGISKMHDSVCLCVCCFTILRCIYTLDRIQHIFVLFFYIIFFHHYRVIIHMCKYVMLQGITELE